MKSKFKCRKCSIVFEEEIEIALANQVLANKPKDRNASHEWEFMCPECRQCNPD